MASTTLTGEEWRNLCLVNVNQMQQFLQGIPGVTEGGLPGMSADHLLGSFNHIERLQQFLTAWSKAKPLVVSQPMTQAPVLQETAIETAANAPVKPKRKGGWPAGKPRGKKFKKPEAEQSQ